MITNEKTNRQMERETWDWQMLLSLGADEKKLREAKPTAEQLRDLVKGLLYLKARDPRFWQ